MKTRGPSHCRYCNHRLNSDAKRCPACKHSQSRMPERCVLLFTLLLVAGLAYYQLYFDGESSRPRDWTGTAGPSADNEQADPTPSPGPAIRTISYADYLDSVAANQPNPEPAQTRLFRYRDTPFLQSKEKAPFYVAEKRWNAKMQRYDFYRKGKQGTEMILRGDARRHFISEDQNDYPEPESGCGPTALLNLYIWYSKFGLLEESITHSDPETYKQLKFKQIDRKLLNIQRQSRTRNGGTNTLAAIVAMDELVQEYAKQGNTRLHFEIKNPPLEHQDFIDLSRNYRVGILSVRPKDKRTGRLLGNHAVLCIRGDTSGMITLANWGTYSHGRLVTRPDGQWFLPSNPEEHEMRINNLTTLIPFASK